MRVVFHPKYDIGLLCLEKLHPFDSKKYGRAWAILSKKLGRALSSLHHRPSAMCTREELEWIHSPRYLDSLRSSQLVARIVEIPPVRFLPNFLVRRSLLKPVRYACKGSIEAAALALDTGFAVNLSGGYHHAKPMNGEGFCIYSDIAMAIYGARQSGKLGDGLIAYIDLDAHQGNGVSHCFMDDPSVRMFDMFNGAIYPHDRAARERIDVSIPLEMGTRGDEYLAKLRERLPAYLDELQQEKEVQFAIYNAGTDPFAGDDLGGMSLTAEEICQRDVEVVCALRERGIPTLMLPSGGYSQESHKMIADSILSISSEIGKG